MEEDMNIYFSSSSSEEEEEEEEEEDEEPSEALMNFWYGYECTLEGLQHYDLSSFSFGPNRACSRWTKKQWRVLFCELKKSNCAVSTVKACLDFCSFEAITYLIDYVGSSPTLKDFTLSYNPEDDVSPETIARYRSKIDDILAAIRRNQSIETLQLHCLGQNPQAIRDLLSGSKSLTTFELTEFKEDGSEATMARAISAGFRDNNSLQHVRICVYQGRLDIMLSGLCREGGDDDDDASSSTKKSLESLFLWHHHPEDNPELCLKDLKEVVRDNPSLKTLAFDYKAAKHSPTIDQPLVADVLKNLHHPEYAGLETLRIDHVNINENDTVMRTSDQANETLKHLELRCVRFAQESSIRIFGKLNGLIRLSIDGSSYLSDGQTDHDDESESLDDSARDLGVDGNSDNGENNSGIDEEVFDDTNQEDGNGADEEDVDDDTNQEDGKGTDEGSTEEQSDRHDYWAEFIRHRTALQQVDVAIDHREMDSAGARTLFSVLRGACGHKSLEKLRFYSQHPVFMPRGQLRSLLQQLLQDETGCLKTLSFDQTNIEPHEDFAAGLAEGLSGNKSLQDLDFVLAETEATNIITILESLKENNTLQFFCEGSFYDYDDSLQGSDDSEAICAAFAGVLRVNKSLSHVSLPCLDLSGQTMRHLLDGLGQSTTLKSLCLASCETDSAGFTLLGQALMDDKTVPLEHIGLPCFPDAQSGSLSSDIAGFFQCLPRMRCVKTVDFNNRTWLADDKDPEDRVKCLRLMLHAAESNKNIVSFGENLLEVVGEESHPDQFVLLSKMEYYLKLNRFGRQHLDSPNVLQSLWPSILVRMASTTDDSDALFFFLQGFFLRNSYPLRRRPRRQELPALPPSSKRARVDE